MSIGTHVSGTFRFSFFSFSLAEMAGWVLGVSAPRHNCYLEKQKQTNDDDAS